MFEITVLVRDSAGNVMYNADGVPKAKSFDHNQGYHIWEFWNRNGGHRKQKKVDNKHEQADQDP